MFFVAARLLFSGGAVFPPCSAVECSRSIRKIRPSVESVIKNPRGVPSGLCFSQIAVENSFKQAS